jgi:2-oxoglutarate dehydrogenase E1 component
VVLTPKSLLRHKTCVSKFQDFTEKDFEPIVVDTNPSSKTERLIFCSGKLFYDLDSERATRKDTSTTIVRIEQFFPIDNSELKKIYAQYGSPSKVVWVQDEPKNMGAWSYIAPVLESSIGIKPIYAGRDAAASPAVGALSIHKLEQSDLIQQAFSV